MKSVFLSLVIGLVSLKNYGQIGQDAERNYLAMRNSIVAIGTIVVDSVIIKGKKLGVKKF